MDNITTHDYNTECRELAQSIAEQAREFDTDPYETLNETVDGHQWIIYNFYHSQIVNASDNENAYTDLYVPSDIGTLIAERGLDHILMIQAYWCMYQDISDLLESALTAYDTEKEEEELEEKKAQEWSLLVSLTDTELTQVDCTNIEDLTEHMAQWDYGDPAPCVLSDDDTCMSGAFETYIEYSGTYRLISGTGIYTLYRLEE